MSDLINSASLRLREIIMDALGVLVAEQEIPAVPLPSFNIEIPADKSHGDFAANTAMVCAKALKMPPRKIAELICDKLSLEGTIFEKAEVAGPGFLNFFLSRKWFSDVVKNVLDEGGDYGKTQLGKGKKVLVEFVSANPTGPMHIGNARGGAIGDCLASVLQWAGYHAEREFYVNDAGNQIEKFGKSLELRYMQLCSDKGQELIAQYKDDTDKLCSVIYEGSGEDGEFAMPEDVYLGTDIIEHAKNFYDINGKAMENVSGEERRKALVDYALPINIAGLERDLKKYRIVYDNWFRESTVHEKNETKLVVDKLMEAGKAY
ncbi:arginine--tRNA ligase, partial [Ruminococcus flavefaciens]|uniref:arginine--tRNA ligase domain-containing protein n=1 Tax=Ruminococcus flavefaciens TaxID=1265 RepID=UPI000382981C